MSSHVSTLDGPLHKTQTPIEKAADLIAQDRVRQIPGARVYRVQGEHGVYDVISSPEGIFCPCPARTALCSHALAVAVTSAPQRLGEGVGSDL